MCGNVLALILIRKISKRAEIGRANNERNTVCSRFRRAHDIMMYIVQCTLCTVTSCAQKFERSKLYRNIVVIAFLYSDRYSTHHSNCAAI